MNTATDHAGKLTKTLCQWHLNGMGRKVRIYFVHCDNKQDRAVHSSSKTPSPIEFFKLIAIKLMHPVFIGVSNITQTNFNKQATIPASKYYSLSRYYKTYLIALLLPSIMRREENQYTDYRRIFSTNSLNNGTNFSILTP